MTPGPNLDGRKELPENRPVAPEQILCGSSRAALEGEVGAAPDRERPGRSITFGHKCCTGASARSWAGASGDWSLKKSLAPLKQWRRASGGFRSHFLPGSRSTKRANPPRTELAGLPAQRRIIFKTAVWNAIVRDSSWTWYADVDRSGSATTWLKYVSDES